MTKLLWDLGTAYDLFISLEVLHSPAEYELPGAWTAGMRARLAAPDREILEQSQLVLHVPVHWIYSLPKPKDAAAAIWTLGQVAPADRLPLLALCPGGEIGRIDEVLRGVAKRGSWNEKDKEAVRQGYQEHLKSKSRTPHSSADLIAILDAWAHPAEFGERYLQALDAYHDVFFAEEENRIRPVLQAGLARARALAEKLPLPDLLEELSQGLRVAESFKSRRLILAPSYWTTPLVYMGKVNSTSDIWVFGARPATTSLVPGELVPDAMVRALKALSDPTRLRILQYLVEEAVTAATLTRRLRLRTPTVLHHLQILRLAGLVNVTLAEDSDLKTYAARREGVTATCAALDDFLKKKQDL